MSNSELDQDQQNIHENTDQNKRKRRPRNDDNNRDYICSCGKSYLSYPALYTHIKTKHEGKAPGDVQMPRTEKGNKLKKYNFKQERQQNEDEEWDGITSINEIIDFMNKIVGENMKYQIGDIFQRFNSEDKVPLMQAIKDWQNNKVKEILQQNGTFNTSIDHKYYVQSGQANYNGKYNNINHLEKEYEQTLSVYSKEANAFNMIEIVNDLILKHFPEEQKNYSSIFNHPKMFINPAYLCKFIYLFSKWLFAQKYTNSKIKFNRSNES